MKSVLLVGFGNVASAIDNDGRSQIFGHISALNNLGINISAVIDNDPSVFAIEYCAKHKIQIFSNYSELIRSVAQSFDLGIFCLPTNRADVTHEILKNISFKQVMLEKPVSYDKGLASDIFELLSNRSTRFIINYQRNWDRGYEKIYQWVCENKVTDGYFRTSTAIAQSGSHMVELILRLFPEVCVKNSMSIVSKRLVGNEVAEPGAVIHFSDDNVNLFSIYDSSDINEFTFSGVIYSDDSKVSFDEGIGEVIVAEKKLGNARIGPQITSYTESSLIHKWTEEDWIIGCYKALFNTHSLKQYQDRSMKVVQIINNIMHDQG